MKAHIKSCGYLFKEKLDPRQCFTKSSTEVLIPLASSQSFLNLHHIVALAAFPFSNVCTLPGAPCLAAASQNLESAL